MDYKCVHVRLNPKPLTLTPEILKESRADQESEGLAGRVSRQNRTVEYDPFIKSQLASRSLL